MNKLSTEEKVRVVACLVEGNSLCATVRLTGIHRTTVQKLLVELGEACSAYQDKVFRNLTCKRVQCDEILSFIGCKAKNVTPDNKDNGWGDVWTGWRWTRKRSWCHAGTLERVTVALLTVSSMTSLDASPVACN